MAASASLSLSSPLHLALLAAVAVALSWALTALVLRLARRRALLDHPNERSSHSLPTPTGGGLGVLAAFLILWLGLDLGLGLLDFPWLPFGVALAGLAWISWADDLRGVSAGQRLLVQAAAVFLVFASEFLGSLGFTGQPVWLVGGVLFVLAIAWIWFINLYNFMDGIDGITAIETISIAGGILVVLSLTGTPTPWATPALLLAAVMGGFLLLNWQPARIFLGDVGSVPIGFLLGWMLIDLVLLGLWTAAIILPLYYWADATLTLLRRGARGEKIWQAHRSHFYQQATAKGWSHGRVSAVVGLCNLGLIGCAAWAAQGAIVPALTLAFLWVGLFLFLFRNPNGLSAPAGEA